jgi:uncharacterized membrane protein YhaH (DUF805 family)
MMSLWQLLFSFEGRIGRAKYWLTTLLTGIVIGVVQFGLEAAFPLDSSASFAGLVIALIIAILYLYMCAAIGAKRLHDRNRSGWLIILFYIVPIGLLPVEHWADSLGAILTMMIALAVTAIALWGLIELGFLRGTRGDNHFGSDPIAPAPSAPISGEPGLA